MQITKTYLEKLKEEGKGFFTCYMADVLTDDFMIIRIVPGTVNRLFFYFSFFMQYPVNITLLKVATWTTPGTLLPAQSLDLGSAAAPTHGIYVDGTGWSPSDQRIIPSPGTDTGKGLHLQNTNQHICGGYIADKNFEYLLSIYNEHTETVPIGFYFIGYEGF